jgi:hypothetical protein
LIALYLIWRFYGHYVQKKGLYDLYYIPGFAVLFVSGVLLIFLGYQILGLDGSTLSPYILPIASLIPLCIEMGINEQYYAEWKKPYKWLIAVGFVAIAITSIAGLESNKKLAVPIFHSVAGLMIFLGPIFAVKNQKAPQGFVWVGVGGALIGNGGIALAFLISSSQLLIFSQEVMLAILSPLLLLMTLVFAWGFVKDIKGLG